MKYTFADRFTRSYASFPKTVQKKFDKQLSYLLNDIRHPSLKAKKFDKSHGIWQARVDRGIRFYFLIAADTYMLLDIAKHT